MEMPKTFTAQELLQQDLGPALTTKEEKLLKTFVQWAYDTDAISHAQKLQLLKLVREFIPQ